jgi:hypothetical protein
LEPAGRLSDLVTASVDHDGERAVEARPEALGEQVVGVALRGARRLRTVVRQAELELQRGQRDHARAHDRHEQERDGAPDDRPCPPTAERRASAQACLPAT